MSNIANMVRDNKKAIFVYYRDNTLYYKTECGFLFGVPTNDAGSATFNAEEKAIILMRYIRRQIESNNKEKGNGS